MKNIFTSFLAILFFISLPSSVYGQEENQTSPPGVNESLHNSSSSKVLEEKCLAL